jgi:hypothetical protein
VSYPTTLQIVSHASGGEMLAALLQGCTLPLDASRSHANVEWDFRTEATLVALRAYFAP